MCGIAGIYSFKGRLNGKGIKKMTDALMHRGPDDEGFLAINTETKKMTPLAGPDSKVPGMRIETFDEAANLFLGHRRLSILDISPFGHQPMCNKDKTIWIVSNGEIYNYLELREELETLGYDFKSNTDTEVLLAAYEERGEKCLDKFNGMWAFLIYDSRRNVLFGARDRFGIKPFYYVINENYFAFASEIKALLATDDGSPSVNYKHLMDYLVIGITDHNEETFFQGIQQLQAGHSILMDLPTGSISIEKYFDLSDHINIRSKTDDYLEDLVKSVHLHLRSDVPVGTCLSGGLDSSVVAALASSINRENGNDRFSAVTAQSESPHNDETAFARQVVEHCNLDWHVTRPLYEDFKKHIEECLRFQEEPVGGPSVFMQYWVMKTAREAGLKVMLDGQGGDETLLGYERYYIAFFGNLFRRRKWLELLKEYIFAARHSKLSFLRLIAYTLYFSILPIRRFVLKRRTRFLKNEYSTASEKTLREISKYFFNLNELQLSEIEFKQLPSLLKYEDRNSMSHAIEARVPYIELSCISAALSLLPEEKIRDGFTKYPLRVIAKDILPSSIAWRREKIGFEAPSRTWLDNHRMIMQLELSNSKILDHICAYLPDPEQLNPEIQWRLYNIAVWEKLYHVQI